MKKRIILGVSAFYHDSAAAILRDGEIIAAAQEERFTRRKHDASFPANAARYCLQAAGVCAGELDAVVFYDKPLLKFERILETYYAFAPRGLGTFLAAMPAWLKEKLMLRKVLRDELAKLGGGAAKVKLLFPEHHLSHAASAFYPSPFGEAAILTIDGVGEWATASISHGRDGRITMLRELRFPHSLGLLYSAFTWYLGFKVNSGEYKLMGLAPYGDPESARVGRYRETIKSRLAAVHYDGSLRLDLAYFDYATGRKMVREEKWRALFGFPARRPGEELRPEHCDLALAVQQVTEEIVEAMARTAKKLTGAQNLCLAGGVALNCVANGRLLRSGLFKGLWIQPAAGDAGGALGAALSAHHIYFGRPRNSGGAADSMRGARLGPGFSDEEIARAALKYGAVGVPCAPFGALCERAAELLAAGCVVGWFQGRMEWGPRALGGRSILADARDGRMQQKLNLKIKFREGFRPFAPSVMLEHAREYFDLPVPSPYMLLTAGVAAGRRNAAPPGYNSWPVRDKLGFARSDIPAVTHVDYSARVQTVDRETSPEYWQLLDAFRRRTGCGVLLNTSFNVRGEPIVLTPEDAYECFMRTEMDYLVMGGRIFDKKLQPAWKEAADRSGGKAE
ncbi:MAG: carbamoyltransferase [Elusimicrobiota bacterium]